MTSLHLPDQIGVMILPECVLFPHGGLPLRIFEDRYRMMLEDAINGDCLIAITQQISRDSADPQKCAALVGTVGIIRASHEQEDGTSNLLLHGVIRVKFIEWLNEKPYPVATIESIHSEFSPAHQKSAATKTLRGSVEDAVRGLPEEVQNAVMEMIHRTDDPVIIADIVSQQFFHDANIRQHLLESESPAARISYLCTALQGI